MTAPGYPPGYYGKAEELAAEARRYLGQEDGSQGACTGTLSRAPWHPVLLQARP